MQRVLPQGPERFLGNGAKAGNFSLRVCCQHTVSRMRAYMRRSSKGRDALQV